MTYIEGLVLAGGKSSRMGQDKMHLMYEGTSFVEHIISVLQKHMPVTVCLNNRQDSLETSAYRIRDHIEDIGPLGGLYSFFKERSADYVLLCACDMPYITELFVAYLLSTVEGSYDAYILRDVKGRISPMCSIYSARVMPYIEEMIAVNDYKMMHLIEKLEVKYIDLSYTIFKDSKVLENINTPSDYKRLIGPTVYAVSGIKNVGKTTVMCELIRQLTTLGLKVGTIKHDGHLFEADCKGTDSYKHKQAGAQITTVYDREKFCVVKDAENLSIEQLLEPYGEMDIVLLEGFKYSTYPKIEVMRMAISTNPVCDQQTVIAYVTDDKANKVYSSLVEKPCYSFEEINTLARYLVQLERS